MNPVALGWLVVLAVAFGNVPPAHACSCVERPFEAQVADADAVFEGRVASVEAIRDDPHGMLRVRLDVVQTWRAANAEHVEVLTAAHSASCGVTFEPGRSYLVLVNERNGELAASLCGGTRPMDDAQDERLALGSGVVPVDVEDDDAPESARPRPAVAPRGGCAGCAVGAGEERGGLTALFGMLAWVAIRRVRIR